MLSGHNVTMKLRKVFALLCLALSDDVSGIEPRHIDTFSMRFNTNPQYRTVGATPIRNVRNTEGVAMPGLFDAAENGRYDRTTRPVKTQSNFIHIQSSRPGSAGQPSEGISTEKAPNGASHIRPSMKKPATQVMTSLSGKSDVATGIASSATQNYNIREFSASEVVVPSSHFRPDCDTNLDFSLVRVGPSLIECICSVDENNPSCCSAIFQSGSMMKPVISPIVVTVPVSAISNRMKKTITVSHNVWKTVTSTKDFNQQQGRVCTSTIVAATTNILCNTDNLMPTLSEYSGKSYDGFHPHDSHGDDYGRLINQPGKFHVTDSCPPGYSCGPDINYCHDKCSNHHTNCWNDQCKADFLRCYDDCFLRHYNADDSTGGKAVLTAHNKVMAIESCHQACHHGPENSKCHDGSNKFSPPKTPHNVDGGCARGYSCQKEEDKIKKPSAHPPPAPTVSSVVPPAPAPVYPAPTWSPRLPLAPIPSPPISSAPGTVSPGPSSAPASYCRHCVGKFHCHRPHASNGTAIVTKSGGVSKKDMVMQSLSALTCVAVGAPLIARVLLNFR